MSQSLQEMDTLVNPVNSAHVSLTTQNIYLYGFPQRTPKDQGENATEEKATSARLKSPGCRNSTMSTVSELIVPNDAPNPTLPLVNQFDSMDEEPFVLETFHDLISEHYSRGKHFIIARVKTRDRIERNRVYYSYFAAHHLNKVLFRVDTRRACLHRMRANNPSNNLPINGRVSYYVVTKESIEENMPEGIDGKQKRECTISRTNDIAVNVVDTIQEQDESVTVEPLSPLPLALTRSRSIRGETSTNGTASVFETPSVPWSIPSADASSLSASKGVTEDGELSSQEVPSHVGHFVATYFANDVDFLNSASVRKIFKENALDASDATVFSFNTDSRQSGRWVPNWNAIQQQDGMTPRRFCSPRHNPNFKWALLLYLVFGFLLIRFVIADQWAYLGAVVGIVTGTVLVIGFAGGCARQHVRNAMPRHTPANNRDDENGWVSRRRRAVNSWLSRIRRRSRSRVDDLETGQAQEQGHPQQDQNSDQATGIVEGTVETRTGDHLPTPPTLLDERQRPRLDRDSGTFFGFGMQQPGHDPSTYRAMSHIGTEEANALTGVEG